MTSAKPKRIALRALARWHRLLGLSSAAFVILLAITGILINHSAGLALEKRHVRAAWLLDRYGIEAPAVNEAFRAGDSWISRTDKRIFFNDREVSSTDEPLLGAVQQKSQIAVASASRILLFGEKGDLLESLGREHGVPEVLRRIGVQDGQLVVQARDGRYRVELDNLRWTRQKTKAVVWSDPESLPVALQTQIGTQARSTMLSVEQVLRDAHSGRIIGSWGVWFMDAVALLFLALAATGIWMWWRAKREFGTQEDNKRVKRQKI